MRNRIYLTGFSEVKSFVNAISDIDGKVELVDSKNNYRVNAKSLLGCLLAHSEWAGDIWVESEKDIYEIIEPWIAVAYNDAANIHE